MQPQQHRSLGVAWEHVATICARRDLSMRAKVVWIALLAHCRGPGSCDLHFGDVAALVSRDRRSLASSKSTPSVFDELAAVAAVDLYGSWVRYVASPDETDQPRRMRPPSNSRPLPNMPPDIDEDPDGGICADSPAQNVGGEGGAFLGASQEQENNSSPPPSLRLARGGTCADSPASIDRELRDAGLVFAPYRRECCDIAADRGMSNRELMALIAFYRERADWWESPGVIRMAIENWHADDEPSQALFPSPDSKAVQRWEKLQEIVAAGQACAAPCDAIYRQLLKCNLTPEYLASKGWTPSTFPTGTQT